MSDRRKRSQISDRFTALFQEASDRSRELKKEVLVSITEESAQVDPLQLFSNTEEFATDRWYWERPSENFAIAGAGVLVGSTPPRNIRFDEANWILQNTLINAIIDTPQGAGCPGALFFAAFSFDPKRKQDRAVWQGFPSTYLLLPRTTLARHGSQHFITFNILVSRNLDLTALKESTLEFRERVLQSLASTYPETAGTVDLDPDGTNERTADSFMDDVTVTESAIRAGVLEKVVLARRRTISTDGTLNVHRALDRLRRDYPTCCTFAAARHGSTFLGVSPQRLVKLDGKQVASDVTAGSSRRGEDAEIDNQLARQLLHNATDLHEHEVSVRGIRDALDPLCRCLDVPEDPEVVSLEKTHYLHTRVMGHLLSDTPLLQLVERLHPTPSAAGYPKEAAVEYLREHEKVDRGWHASPFGWIDSHGNGEFVVATPATVVRTPVLHVQRAHLFSECGVVSGTDPEHALAKSNLNLQTMISALTD